MNAEYMQIMLRHRAGRQLDPSKSWNIENAYLACKPRDTAAVVPVAHTPLERYIHHLLFTNLASSEAKIDQTVKRMRRLPWADCEAYVLKCCLQVCMPPAKAPDQLQIQRQLHTSNTHMFEQDSQPAPLC